VGSTRNDDRCIDCGEKRISQQSKGGKLLGLSCSFSFLVSQSTCRLPSMLRPSVHPLCLMEEIFIKFHADADSFHWYETSRPKQALAWVEMTFSWIDRTGWVHKVACELIMTHLKSGWTPWWVLDRIGQYKNIISVEWLQEAHTEPQWYGLMIDGNQGVHLAESEWYASRT
jgi:hypothetical protein